MYMNSRGDDFLDTGPKALHEEINKLRGQCSTVTCEIAILAQSCCFACQTKSFLVVFVTFAVLAGKTFNSNQVFVS